MNCDQELRLETLTIRTGFLAPGGEMQVSKGGKGQFETIAENHSWLNAENT